MIMNHPIARILGITAPTVFRTIIAGGRDYHVTEADEQWLDTLPIGEVVCGCARGADTGGERWAAKRGIPVAMFPADWDKHGKGAGHIRNREMADHAEAVVLFPGGRGTANMKQTAERLGLVIYKRPQSLTP